MYFCTLNRMNQLNVFRTLDRARRGLAKLRLAIPAPDGTISCAGVGNLIPCDFLIETAKFLKTGNVRCQRGIIHLINVSV